MSQSSSVKQAKLLIVDDKQASQILLRAYLTRLGFTDIAESSDSFDALSKLMLAKQENAPFAAMFIDWTLPEMRDLELVKTIRKLPGWNEFPIIVMSEELDQKRVEQVYLAGASTHLLRPITEDDLRSILEKIV